MKKYYIGLFFLYIFIYMDQRGGVKIIQHNKKFITLKPHYVIRPSKGPSEDIYEYDKEVVSSLHSKVFIDGIQVVDTYQKHRKGPAV